MLKIAFLITLLILTKNFFGKELYRIPFEVKGDRIFINVQVNKTKCKFLFDTGAFTSSIDSMLNVKEKFNIKPSKNLVNVTINNFTTNKSFGVLDHNKYGGGLYDGIIGISFFAEYLVEINYDDNELRLYSKDDDIINRFQKLHTIHHMNNMVIFGLFSTMGTIYLNETDSISGNFLIDTGSSRNITILEKKASSFETANLKQFSIEYFNASNHGFNKSRYYKIPNIKFFNHSIDSVVIDCSYGKNGNLSNFCDGIIGGQFLKNFNLLIDYENSLFYIKRKENNNLFCDKYISDGIGLKYQDNKSINPIISSIITGSCQNVKLGDIVLRINGESPIRDSIFKGNFEIGKVNTYTIERNKEIFEISTEVRKLL